MKSKGTSPRTRGKRFRWWRVPGFGRNIPAHAGKTGMTFFPIRQPEEHPRARGENNESAGQDFLVGGTSPRTRGKQPIDPSMNQKTGNIPAHAGKTPGFSRSGGF